MRLIFEWHDRKARLNRRKHGVEFEEAISVFDDPGLVSFPDEHHSEVEDRRISIGVSGGSRILLVVHTEFEFGHDALLIRIISCRRATSSERRVYEENGR